MKVFVYKQGGDLDSTDLDCKYSIQSLNFLLEHFNTKLSMLCNEFLSIISIFTEFNGLH